LNAEIEARHDVTKVGMTGFYSNLLTKNVSAGASTKDYSISAYTAGGTRQSTLLSEGNDGDLGTSVQGEPSYVVAVAAPQESPIKQELKPSSVTRENERIKEDKEVENLKQEVKQDQPASNSVRTEDKVLSAKERYLARKRLQEEKQSDI
jgi:hypothetical protein